MRRVACQCQSSCTILRSNRMPRGGSCASVYRRVTAELYRSCYYYTVSAPKNKERICTEWARFCSSAKCKVPGHVSAPYRMVRCFYKPWGELAPAASLPSPVGARRTGRKASRGVFPLGKHPVTDEGLQAADAAFCQKCLPNDEMYAIIQMFTILSDISVF